jgi:predicted ATPase
MLMTVAIPVLPQPAQPIIGRNHELAHLSTLLHDPACRLLTLVGPGGMGKTRLALELAIRQQERFADGVVFVALQSLSTATGLIPAIANAVGCPRVDGDDARGHLLAFLHHQQMLLVLDNFEHLLESSDLVVDLLEAAPDLTVLVPSREVLNVRDEWRYALGGLTVPAGSTPDEIDHTSAVQLFVERARHMRADFALDHERAHVLRICCLVEGMSLALTVAGMEFVLDLLNGQMGYDLHWECHWFLLTAYRTPRHACYHTCSCSSEGRWV